MRPTKTPARGENVGTDGSRSGDKVKPAYVPDTGVCASELLNHIIWIAAIAIENDAM